MNNDSVFYKALLERDSSFEGIFIVGVKTTGIFCRPTCSARKPKPQNVEFFDSTKDAILKGYRPCKVCRPMEQAGQAPDYILDLLKILHKNPAKKLKDEDIRLAGFDPVQIRRWFVRTHGITFHAYQRMLKINQAFMKYKEVKNVTDIAFYAGYESLSGFNDSFKKLIGYSPQKSIGKSIINLTRIETPLGTMIACATEKGICLLEFTDRKMLDTELKHLTKSLKSPIIQGDNKHFEMLREQLYEYFSGYRTNFDIPLDPIGTPFQKDTWNVLRNIPYGTTISYAEEAAILNKPSAVRAVASANGMNKIAIIIPCHRVIGSDGSLTGYAGGLWRKKKLLELEKEIKKV